MSLLNSTKWRQGIIILQIELLLIAPFFGLLLPSKAHAEDTPTIANKCSLADANLSATHDLNIDNNTEDPGESAYQYQVDLKEAKKNPLFSQEQFDKYLTQVGGKESAPGSNFYLFCTPYYGLQQFESIPVDFQLRPFFDTLGEANNRLVFKTKQDQYAVLGEPCRKFIGNVCDETVEDIPVEALDSSGNPIIDAAGNTVYLKDAAGNTVTESKPKYYDDTIWPNGKWDAPKADARILKTLVYLTTPVEYGGGGRERIKVGKILQNAKTDKEFTKKDAEDQSVSADGKESSEDTQAVSAHFYDQTNPESPAKLAQAMDITEIDNIRMTTKTEKKKRLGGSSISYNYRNFPIKVSWQTDEGQNKAGIPPVNIYEGAQVSFNSSLLELLDGMDLDNADFDATETDTNSIGDLGQMVGESLISHLFNSPGGSLRGWDVTSTLERFGRMYLAGQLGLQKDALLEGNTVDELVRNVGRVSTEKILGLPSGSLRGNPAEGDLNVRFNSEALLTTVGRRFLESKVFKVSEGTLIPDKDHPIATTQDVYQRLGEGRIEQRFHLKPQSMRVSTIEEAKKTSFKAQTIFSTDAITNDYVDSTLVDEGLSIDTTSNQAGQDVLPAGISAEDFNSATEKVIGSSGDSAALSKYKTIVGFRTIMSGIGSAQIKPVENRITLLEGDDSVANIGSATGGKNNFILYFLNQFGITIDTTAALGQQVNNKNFNNNVDAIVTTALDTDTAKMLTADPDRTFLTAELRTFLKDLLVDQANLNIQVCKNKLYDKDKGYYCPDINADTLTINKRLTAPGGWKERLTTKYNLLKTKLNRIQKNDNQVDTEQVRQSALIFENGLTIFNSYLDSLLTLQTSQNQSGRSAALGIPGQIYKADDNGNQSTNGLLKSDPINSVLNGDLSVLSIIGRSLVAGVVTPAPAAKQTLAGQIHLNNLSTISDQINALAKRGLSDVIFQDKGLIKGDFDRIFEYSLGAQVFQRIGESELLRTAWNKSDLDRKISESITGSQDSQRILQKIQDISQDFDFYSTRVKRLGELSDSVSEQADKIATLAQEVKDALKDRSKRKEEPKTISGIKIDTEKYEVAFKKASECLDQGAPCAQVKKDVEEATHIIQEIQAGHPLSFTQSAESTPVGQGSASTETCWSRSALRDIIIAKDINKTIADFAIGTAACQIDNSLNLPPTSMSRWYESKDLNNYDSFLISVGLADMGSEKKVTDIRDSQDSAFRDLIKKRGETVLISRAVSTIANLIPGVSSFTNRYNITSKDIYAMLHGNVDVVLKRVGGAMIDQGLGWDPGTASNLMSPLCFKDANAPPSIDNQRTCTRKEAENIRLKTMAQLGLKELGWQLDFPQTFQLNAGGNFLGNYGNALISEALGIRSNSLKGSFLSVVAGNDPHALAMALGLYDSPIESKLLGLRTKLYDIAQQKGELADVGQTLLKKIDAYISQKAVTNLTGKGGISDYDSGYWNPEFNYKTCDLPDNQVGENIATTEGKEYQTFISDLQSYAGQIGVAYQSEISNLVAEFTGKPDNYFSTTYGSAFTDRASFFRCRLEQLNTQFKDGLKLTQINDDGTAKSRQELGSFEQFVLGDITADQLTKAVGTSQLTSKLTQSAIDGLIKDPSIKETLAIMQDLTRSDNCPDGLTPAGLVLGNKDKCGFSGLADINLNALFAGGPDPSGKNALVKNYLYDHFLSRIFSHSLEREIGLDQGTFRNMIMNPRKAQEIATEQGLNLIADQIFGKSAGNYNDGKGDEARCASNISQLEQLQSTVTTCTRNSLKEAFMAGFYDTTRNQYTLNFDASRSTKLLQDRFNKMLDEMTGGLFNSYSKSLIGVPMSRSDLNAIIGGDINTISYVGLQWYISDLNKGLSGISNSNNDAISQRKKALAINYMDVRDAMGIGTISDSELALPIYDAQANYVLNVVNPDYCAKDDCQNDPISTVEGYRADLEKKGDIAALDDLDAVGETAQSDYLVSRKKYAQEKLQYKVFDIYAFKVNQNIPAGFTYAMLKGTSAQKVRTLGSFAISALNLDQSLFGGFLSSEEIVNLIEFAGNGFKDGKDFQLNMNAMGKLDSWFSAKAGDLLGLPDMPTGVLTGFFAWGSTGFDGNSFDKSHLASGPFANVKGADGQQGVASMGAVLKDYGVNKLFAWADKTLGFSPGATFQIYQTAVQVSKAQQTLNLIDAGKAPAGVTKDGAIKQMKEASALLVTTIINMAFSKQIAQAEEALGLVPGTGSIAVGILVSLAFGLPVNPISIALFVGINLFGVYKVVITIRATGDGYYPFTGTEGIARSDPQEYPSPDDYLGDFNAKNTQEYRSGLKLATQNKVRGVLKDLLVMPEQWGEISGEDPASGRLLWASQVFTRREEDLQQLDYLISRPAPWENPKGFGYGDIEKRATQVYDEKNQWWTGKANDAYRAGFFFDPTFWDHIHIRF